MDNVIEVSSSPEPFSPPRFTKKTAPHLSKRAPKRPFHEDVIELTDSEPDGSPPKRLKQAASTPPVAGPSRARRTPSSSGSHITPGASQTSTRPSTSKTPLAASTRSFGSFNTPVGPSGPPTDASRKELGPFPVVPLFLPSDDEGSPHKFQPYLERATTQSLKSSADVLGGIHLSTLPENTEKIVLPTPPDSPDADPIVPLSSPPEVLDEIVLLDPPDADPIDVATVRVLEIIPDVRLDHLTALIIQHLPTAEDKIVDVVISALLEDAAYPRTESKGKRKRLEKELDGDGDRTASKPKIDYADKGRNFKGGPVYERLALVRIS